MLQIAIVDDHLLFRKSMTLLINSFEGIKVVIDAENGKVFLNKLKTTPVDVVLLDIEMPVMDGYETSKRILKSYPDIKILIVSQLSSRESIHKIMDIGAHGYFTKNSNPDQLELALNSIHTEGFYFGIELGAVIKEALLWEKNNPIDKKLPKHFFTERELEIIKLICKERKSNDIAKDLCITLRTVESHRKNIMDKSHAKNFIGVLLYALRNEHLVLDDLPF